jgi:hypothetical protein
VGGRYYIRRLNFNGSFNILYFLLYQGCIIKNKTINEFDSGSE